jgi:cytochrome c oxidase assembly factor CtaG
VTAGQLALDGWIWAPGIVLVLATAVGAYFARFRLAHLSRSAALLGAAGVAVVALMSPVAVLARSTLFSAHMLQHVLLALVVPPLALLSIPRQARGTHALRRGAVVGWPYAAPWAAGVGAMWIWHAPMLCNVAATSDLVRALQSISLPAMGTAFWWPILGPRVDQRLPEPTAIAYLFTACGACTVLGAAITFSPVEVCSAYGHSADPLNLLPLVRGRLGLTPSVDQQLGGLLMWVPGCTLYAAAILVLVARFLGASHEEADVATEVP